MLKDISFSSVQEIEKYQSEKLTEVLQYVAQNSAFYKKQFAHSGIDISTIQSLNDLQKLPVTTKEDLQKNNNDFVCVHKNEIIDYITTSGTLGDPVTFGATENDLQRLAQNEYSSFTMAGGTKEDIYHLMVTIDRRFMAGLAYFLGIRKLGAGVVRVGPGNPKLQFDTIKRVSPTILVTIPSFLIKLIEFAEEHGIDYNASTIKSAVCIGEPIRDSNFNLNKLGKRIKEKWDIDLYSTYASTEMGAAFTECNAGKGGHLNPEMLIVEFLDDNNQPVAEDELGEITITNIGVEGMPLVRFKTGDICYHFKEKCACGRNSLRIGPIVGRKNQMMKYKGTTLFPSTLYDALNDMVGVDKYVIEVSTNNIDTDEILVKVSSNDTSKAREKEMKDHFRAKLRVAPKIEFISEKELNKLRFPEMSRKPISFIDKRNVTT